MDATPEQLSWSESATLAVLPNAPSLIHPGRNRDALRAKRNRLLERMRESGVIDSVSCKLAMLEPLPEKPLPLPNLAPHMIDRVHGDAAEGIRFQSTLDLEKQDRTTQIINRHIRSLQENGIHNAAALVLDVATGEVLAYVGNANGTAAEHGYDVDIVQSRRSTGSILKPFLYASMLDDGVLLPEMLVADIPTYYGAYNPQNYHRSYDGAVPAKRALARSLNIPAIRMLSDYGHRRLYHRLQNWA